MPFGSVFEGNRVKSKIEINCADQTMSQLIADVVYFRVYGEEDVLEYTEPSTWHVVTRDVDLNARLDLVLLSSECTTDRIIDELRIGPTWRSVAPIQQDKE